MPNPTVEQYSSLFKDLLSLDFSPVAVAVLKTPLLKDSGEKMRICQAILQAGRGTSVQLDKKNNACFGAAWHLGFYPQHALRMEKIAKKFAVQEEKLFSSYQALDNLLSKVETPPDNSEHYFVLAPLEKALFEPQLVIFIVNPAAACRILSLVTFSEGQLPQVKIGGPTCRMSIITPLVSGEINLSFYDYTSRKLCKLPADKLIISIPYEKIPQLVSSINKCCAGRAEIKPKATDA